MIIVTSCLPVLGEDHPHIRTWGPVPLLAIAGWGVIPNYEHGWREAVKDHSEKSSVIAFIHDDVEIREEGWHERVEKEFQDPTVGLVGFGGAYRHGTADIYKTPYRLTQLGRDFYLSNTDDAESHGVRFTGEADVAVLDGFCLIFRKALLEKMGGWMPERWPPHHVYDYRACCEAHRHGYRIRVVGVRCHHYGGVSACREEYQKWAKEESGWGGDSRMHELGHRMIYDEYGDVLPWREE